MNGLIQNTGLFSLHSLTKLQHLVKRKKGKKSSAFPLTLPTGPNDNHTLGTYIKRKTLGLRKKIGKITPLITKVFSMEKLSESKTPA
jgi:hypothetical protein